MRPLLRLPQPIIILTNHLRPQTNQKLLNAHIPIPTTNRSNSALIDIAIGIDTVQIDFGDEFDLWGYDGVVFGDGYFEVVDSIFEGGLIEAFLFIVCILFFALYAWHCGGGGDSTL